MKASPLPEDGGPSPLEPFPGSWFERVAPEEILGHTEWLRGLARALVGDHAAAEDLAQDTLHAAAVSTRTEVKDVRAYLAGTVRFLAAKRWRSERSRRRREDEVAEARSTTTDAADDHAERVDTLRVVLEELRQLGPAQQRVVYLRFLEGLEPGEIAARVGSSASTVRSQVARGLQALRARLDARSGGRDAWCGLLMPWAFNGVHHGLTAASSVSAKASSAAAPASSTGGQAAASSLGTGLFTMSIQSVALAAVTVLAGAAWFVLPERVPEAQDTPAHALEIVTQLDDLSDVDPGGAIPMPGGTPMRLALQDPKAVAPGEDTKQVTSSVPLEPEVVVPVGPTYELEFPSGLDLDPTAFSVSIRALGTGRDLAVVRVQEDPRCRVQFPASVAEHDSEGPWELIARQDGGGPIGRAQVQRKKGLEIIPVHLRFESQGFLAFRLQAEEDRAVAGLALAVRPIAEPNAAKREPIAVTWVGSHPGSENVVETPSLVPGTYEWRIDDGTDEPWREVQVKAGEETIVAVGPDELGQIVDLFVRLDVRALQGEDHQWLTYAFRESAREFFHQASMGPHPDDPDGFLRVRLEGVREGAWFVQLQLDPGVEASLNPIRVVTGEAAPTVVLTPAQDRVPLRVRVVAEDTGEPIANAQAAFLRTISDAGLLAGDGESGFVAAPVKRGVPLTLVASAPGYQDHAERFVPTSPGNEVTIELVRGYRERVVVVNMTTSEFEANVGVFADGVEVGRTDGDGALWLTGTQRPETLDVAVDDPEANVVYSSFSDFQRYGETSPLGWIFGVTRR